MPKPKLLQELNQIAEAVNGIRADHPNAQALVDIKGIPLQNMLEIAGIVKESKMEKRQFGHTLSFKMFAPRHESGIELVNVYLRQDVREAIEGHEL